MQECPICRRYTLDGAGEHVMVCARLLAEKSRKLAQAAEDYQDHYVVDGESTRDALADAISKVREHLGRPK